MEVGGGGREEVTFVLGVQRQVEGAAGLWKDCVSCVWEPEQPQVAEAQGPGGNRFEAGWEGALCSRLWCGAGQAVPQTQARVSPPKLSDEALRCECTGGGPEAPRHKSLV